VAHRRQRARTAEQIDRLLSFGEHASGQEGQHRLRLCRRANPPEALRQVPLKHLGLPAGRVELRQRKHGEPALRCRPGHVDALPVKQAEYRALGKLRVGARADDLLVVLQAAPDPRP
jgi:hypothetical protein